MKRWCLFFQTIIFLVVLHNTRSIFSKEDETKKLFKESYFNYEQLTDYLHYMSEKYSNIIKVHSIGKSVQNRNLWVVEINTDAENRSLLKPMFKYVANMHGDEAVGRQLLVFLLDYLLENYGKDSRITKLMNETNIFLMPSVNPDGFENSQVQ